METRNKLNFDVTAVKHILTLRYNPLWNSSLPKISPENFIPKNNDVRISSIEKFLQSSLVENLSQDKIAISLSGGVDSSLVLGLIHKFFPDIDVETISVQFSDSTDETPTAVKIAEHYGAHSNVIFVDNYLEELPKAISIIKQPFWDLHWYYVVKHATSLTDVLVSGDGGDELFGGYTFRYEKFLEQTHSTSLPIEKVKSYIQCHQRDHVPDQEYIFNKNSNFNWNEIYDLLLPYFDNNLTPLEQVFLADYNGKLLHNFSPISQSISKFFNIKTFSPLLSNDLINFSMKIPLNQKYNQEKNIGKILLRELLSQLKLDSFVEKQKLGFSVNTTNYWKSFGHRLCKDYLEESNIVKDGWINQDWITKHLDKDELDVRYINKFLGLLAVEIWYRLFITKEIDANTKLS